MQLRRYSANLQGQNRNPVYLWSRTAHTKNYTSRGQSQWLKRPQQWVECMLQLFQTCILPPHSHLTLHLPLVSLRLPTKFSVPYTILAAWRHMTGHNNIHALLHCNIFTEKKQNGVFFGGGEWSTSSCYICPINVTLFILRSILYYKCAVPQIGRSLVRSQLVSVDFSLT